MRNLRLDICYDGTRYKGWQRLAGTDNTLQGKLETTLSRILGEAVEVTASGRTDAGTHARLQVINVHCNSTKPCEEILEDLRRYLPEDIGIYSCRNVSERFHARLNAKSKTYRYRVWNSDAPCVFERRFVWKEDGVINVELMQRAANYYVGTHDFSAFCGNKNMKKSTVRTIFEFDVHRNDNEICFTVRGNGFLQHMVRIMVGTLLEVGRGERDADTIPQLFGAQRMEAGPAVPSCGLCLMEVTY